MLNTGAMAHLTPLHTAAADAVATGAGVPREGLKVDSTPRPELGDLAVGTFALAKALGKNPAEAAAELAAGFQPTELLASATAAGPFVNFRANRPAVFKWLIGAALDRSLLPRELGAGQTIVIDYSSPNVSKHLAYHHIRSTMLGHSLVQIFRALGYTVVGLNHLGDWGTTHGKLIAAWKKWGPTDPDAVVDIAVLNDLYVKFTAAAKLDPALDAEGRAEFKKLEDGDPAAHALWSRFKEISLAEYQTAYDALGVQFDLVKGESEYLPDVPRVLADLAAKGLSSESEGALVVMLADEKTPLLLKKSDDATLYSTRDIPSAEFRWNTWHFARSLYVVDRGQSLHFRQLFKTLALMGHEWAAKCEHVPFGLVQIGGKKGSTKAGNVVLLKDVLGEAEARVRSLLEARVKQSAETLSEMFGDEKATELAANPNIDKISQQVGRGAVVFANLVAQRDKDVAFEWDRVIALQGDSGPYLQYVHARCYSILEKGGVIGVLQTLKQERAAGEDLKLPSDWDLSLLSTDAEWAVARKLLDYPAAVVGATPRCEPHIICHYLLGLAGEFSAWYTAGNGSPGLRVLCDDPQTRKVRLALVIAVMTVMEEGLRLLGMSAPNQM